jgi:hypothetical protein
VLGDNVSTELLSGGAKGSGKTDLIIKKILPYVHVPGGLAVILRETYGELGTIIDRIKVWANALPPSQRPAYVGSPRPTFTWPSGHRLELGHCRRVEDLRWIQGREPWYIGIDELGNQRDEAIIDTCVAEIRTKVPGLPMQFMGTGNPGKAGHQMTKRRYVIPTANGTRLARIVTVLPNGRELSTTRRFIRGYVWDNPRYRNDERYLARLLALPERQRMQLLFGDYDVGGGLGFEELLPAVHLVRPFPVPSHWHQVGGFDWGFAHPSYYVRFAIDEDGQWYLVRAIRMHRQSDESMAETILRLDPRARQLEIFAGRGAFDRPSAHTGLPSPSCADVFAGRGLTLVPGADSKLGKRQAGLAVTRWRNVDGVDRVPQLRFFDSEDVRQVYQQWEDAVENPDDPETLLKIDANDSGEGGDDGLDASLVALASQAHLVSADSQGLPADDDLAWRRARQQQYDPRDDRTAEVLT